MNANQASLSRSHNTTIFAETSINDDREQLTDVYHHEHFQETPTEKMSAYPVSECPETISKNSTMIKTIEDDKALKFSNTTAKNHKSRIAQHHYRDYGSKNADIDKPNSKHKHKDGETVSFPTLLHKMLGKIEKDGYASIVSWQPHGRVFVVHKQKDFIEYILPNYFRQSKMKSFQRQLNRYGFCRLFSGRDKGGYYHELFLRGKLFLTKQMTCTKVKGTEVRGRSNPDAEPNFYSMPPVVSDAVSGTENPEAVSDFYSLPPVVTNAVLGIGVRGYSNPETEPNFHSIPQVVTDSVLDTEVRGRNNPGAGTNIYSIPQVVPDAVSESEEMMTIGLAQIRGPNASNIPTIPYGLSYMQPMLYVHPWFSHPFPFFY